MIKKTTQIKKKYKKGMFQRKLKNGMKRNLTKARDIE